MVKPARLIGVQQNERTRIVGDPGEFRRVLGVAACKEDVGRREQRGAFVHGVLLPSISSY